MERRDLTPSKIRSALFLLILFLATVGALLWQVSITGKQRMNSNLKAMKLSHWLLLERKSNKERLYYGIPGNEKGSRLLKTFIVKSGIPRERPTPLPQLVKRDYWVITSKEEVHDNPETMPYFLTLDIPVTDEEPYGPVPYEECNGQCNWLLPGSFGLHGINGDMSRMAAENTGSSGCVRHSDEDISFLYQTLDPSRQEIRYYIRDI